MWNLKTNKNSELTDTEIGSCRRWGGGMGEMGVGGQTSSYQINKSCNLQHGDCS